MTLVTIQSRHIIFNAFVSVKLNEEVSDTCMSELMGSHKTGGQSCDISERCAETMSAPGLVGYGITHQLLWIMLAEKVRPLLYQAFFSYLS